MRGGFGVWSKGSGSSASRRPRPRSRGLMLPSQIERLFDEAPAHYEEKHFWLFRDFKAALNGGEIRAAEPDASAKSGWRANPWVKKGILLGFRMAAVPHLSSPSPKQPLPDNSTHPR